MFRAQTVKNSVYHFFNISCSGQQGGELPFLFGKGPVKLIKRVKIAHSFLQSVSNQFHVIILSLPMSMKFCKLLSKNFLKPTSENGDMGHCNL